MSLIKSLALLSLLLPSLALAHGGGPHVMGVVKAADDKAVTVTTTDGKEVKVAFNEKTRFQNGEMAGSVKELVAGLRVVVHTAKEPSGEMLAVLVKYEAAASAHAAAPPAPLTQVRTLAMTVDADGFSPAHAKVTQGQPVDLVITRKTDDTCATEITIPDYAIKKDLPLNQAVTIRLTPKKSGPINYSCAMGMHTGVLDVQ